MNKFYIALLVLPLIFTSCKSKEEKAAELIKTELSKTLYDFESYSPIETIVTEAKQNEFTDTTCWKRALVLTETFSLANESLEKVKDAQDYMDIWGPPSYYSSDRSDKKYYEYKEERDKHMIKVRVYTNLMKTMGTALKGSINSLNANIIVGWEVAHKFRCKTKGGHSTICVYRYVIDKNFETILIQEDCDDSTYTTIREMIDAAKKDEFNSIEI